MAGARKLSPRARGIALGLVVFALMAGQLVGLPAARAAECPTIERESGLVTPAPTPGVDWSGCDLTYADFSGADLTGSNLSGADLSYADLSGTNLSGTNLEGTKFGLVIDLSGGLQPGLIAGLAFLQLLSWADLTGATGCDITGTPANLPQSVSLVDGCLDTSGIGQGAGGCPTVDPETGLTTPEPSPGVDWTDCFLDGADLSGASMSDAVLAWAWLEGADLSGADLRDADLSDADLTDVDFTGADLSGARLSGAYVGGANFTGANLGGVEGCELYGEPAVLPPGYAIQDDCLVMIAPADDAGPQATLVSLLPAADASGWYNGDVTATWSWDDGEGLGVDEEACEQTATSVGEGENLTLSAACSDLAGNTTSVEATVKVDKTTPVLGQCPAVEPLLLNGPGDVGPITASDALSGVDESASTLTGTVPTTAVGTQTVTFTAVDIAGNTSAVDCGYTVSYGFAGFQPPVRPDGVNRANAGRTLPLKFAVADANGDPVTDLANAVGVAAPCGTDPLGPGGEQLETRAGLKHLGDGVYRLNVVTGKSWLGSCRSVGVDLGDGVARTVDYRFG